MASSTNQNQLEKHGKVMLGSDEAQWSQPLQSMALWSRINSMAADYGEEFLHGRYLRIRFEDLCEDPLTTIRRIFDFFCLEGDIEKIAYQEVQSPASLGRWQQQNEETLVALHRIGSTALRRFGYGIPNRWNVLGKPSGGLGEDHQDSALIGEGKDLKKHLPMDKMRVICILGMHRSGTSLVSRILNLLGVYLGPDAHIMPPGPDNPKGYWEHDLIRALNDEILARLGGSWHEPPTFLPGWESAPELADLRQRARAILQEDFATAALWGWKDPRTCLTLPFWQKLLPAMRYVICLRNPVDVARSLERRNNFPFEKEIKLWLTHVISALQHTAGQPRLFVFYEDIMENWPREVRRLAGFLGRPELVEQKAIQQSIQEFIEEELQHHRTSLVDAAGEPKLSFPAKALYMVLRTYATYQQQKPDLEVEDSTLQTAIDVFSSYTLEAATEQEKLTQLVTVLREQVAQSEQQIGALQASLQAERERLTRQVAEKEQAIQQLQSQLAERDQFIHSITGSRAWLLVRFLWWLRPRVAPDGSWRQRFLYSVLRLTGFVLRRARKWVSGL